MNQRKCLYCYNELNDSATDFHEKCSRAFFGTVNPPLFSYDKDEMQRLAQEVVGRSITVPGVQPKLSLEIERDRHDPKLSRLTIVGLWGAYILKPPTDVFPNLPENEDLTMHLSAMAGIPTANHSLIRMKSGELAYITKRFDRNGAEKLPMEDMCQLTEMLTENKYRSSMEKVGKKVLEHSAQPGLDAIRFFELALFSFVTGNADMHLKNFSLLTTDEIRFSPAYDLVNTKLAMPEDLDESALTINGRKRKIKLEDFISLSKMLRIPQRAAENSIAGLLEKEKLFFEMITKSFMNDDHQEQYRQIIKGNILRLKG